jgi:hypothetical protein
MRALLEVLGNLARQVWRVNLARLAELLRVRRGRRELQARKEQVARTAYLDLRGRGVPPERLGHLELLDPPAPPEHPDPPAPPGTS